MLQIIPTVLRSYCINRTSTLLWFVRQRFGGRGGTHIVEFAMNDRTAKLLVSDVPSLCVALVLLSKGNPWESWRPATPPRRIMDLGANVGLASLYFHLRFPTAELVAVEMMPDNAAALKQLADMNAMPMRILNVAVGDQSGEAVVRCNEDHMRHRLVTLEEEVSPTWGFTEKRMTVPIRKLAEVLDMAGWPEADLIKIDIEGAEELLLRDLAGWANRVRTAFMEIHHNVKAADAAAEMKRHGFQDIGGGEHSGNRTELWFARPGEPAR